MQLVEVPGPGHDEVMSSMGDQGRYTTRVDAIERTWDAWATLGARLQDSEWATPTRCPGWSVADVYAHASNFPRTLAIGPPPPPDAPVGRPLTASDVLGRFNRPDGVAHTMAASVAHAAIEDAAGHRPDDLVERFTDDGRRAVDLLRNADPAMIVPWPGSGGVVLLVEALRIVLMESVVHLLDVHRALELPPEIPDAALRETSQLLTELAPAVQFIEAMTGRGAALGPVLR